MARWTGTTTQRGYGNMHQAERRRRLARYRPGDICAHCGQPMTAWPLEVARRFIDLPHNDDRTGYLPGLAHRSCNRADGARRGNIRRGQRLRMAALRVGRQPVPANRGQPSSGWTPSGRW
jgi:hypothetical protein